MSPCDDAPVGLTPSTVLVQLLLLSLLCHVSAAVAGDRTEINTANKLNRISRDNRDGLDALTRSIRQQSRGQIPDIVQIWMTGDANMTWKSAYILGRLGDAAIEPLLEADAPVDPLRQAWRLKRITQVQLNRREAIVEELVNQLENRTPVPFAVEKAPIEDPVVEQRLCDVAYLHLRRLLNTSEKLGDQLDTARIYRRLDPGERDLVIERYKKLGVWVNLFEEESIKPVDSGVLYTPLPME